MPLFPEAASSTAASVDYLYWYMSAVTVIMTALIFFTVFIFAIKYRRRSPDEIPPAIHGSLRLEIAWSVIPFIVMLTFFWWGAEIFFANASPPSWASSPRDSSPTAATIRHEAAFNAAKSGS